MVPPVSAHDLGSLGSLYWSLRKSRGLVEGRFVRPSLALQLGETNHLVTGGRVEGAVQLVDDVAVRHPLGPGQRIGGSQEQTLGQLGDLCFYFISREGVVDQALIGKL